MTRLHYASTSDAHMRYLVGTQILDPFFFLEHEGRQLIFLGSTDVDAVRARSPKDVEVVDVGPFQRDAALSDGCTPGVLATRILDAYHVTDAIEVPSNFPIAIADVLRERSFAVIAVNDFCPHRTIKTNTEIAQIRDVCAHTVRAYALIEDILAETVIDGDSLLYKDTQLTSEYLKREVARFFLEHALESPAGMIISCGAHAAMPHHLGTGPLRPHTTIIVDLFPQSTKSQYFADMTRTYVTGEVSVDIEKMYEAVAAAKAGALAVLRPGLPCSEAYAVSADVIRAHGFDVGAKGYIHSLGHGLGVDVHEAPTLSARSSTILEVGNVVTIEPGLYYPDIGGVRIEDTVLITEDGYENLTNYPQNWRVH